MFECLWIILLPLLIRAGAGVTLDRLRFELRTDITERGIEFIFMLMGCPETSYCQSEGNKLISLVEIGDINSCFVSRKRLVIFFSRCKRLGLCGCSAAAFC